MRKLGRKTEACGKHGKKYFIFKGVGPCMHPECGVARLRLWAKTSASSRRAFRPVMDKLDDFLIWGMTDGAAKLGYDWDSRLAWEEAVPSYLRKLKLENAQRAVATETETLLFLANTRGAVGSGYNKDKCVYPDGVVFARQCVAFISKAFGTPMAAYILDVIDLQDLAKLCYGGEVLVAKGQVSIALEALREWFDGQSTQHPKNNSEQRL